MSISIEQFMQQLVDSSLISAGDLSAIRTSINADEQTVDVEQLAKLLVKQRKITPFQAKQLYNGKGKSLVLGNYLILDKLGQGGMGMVLKAEHRRMKRTVALKVLSPAVTKSPEAVRRFQREVEAVAKLEHPNIVTAHDADEANDTHFLVMQYVEGKDLAELIKDKGLLSVAKATNYILQAARGLEYAHSRGVVHRDIKPANLLLDRNGTVKILDMGLARVESMGAQQDQLTGTGQIMGTIDFMAPEQAMNTKDADARADIYSLGITLWYLLTGRVVYEGESLMAKLLAHRERPIPSLRQVCSKATPDLESVFVRMVAKTPDARYQSMSELIADLEKCEIKTETSETMIEQTTQFSSRDMSHGQQSIGPGLLATEVVPQTAQTSPNTAPTVALQSALLDTISQKQETPSHSESPQPNLQRQSRFGTWPPIAKWMALGGGAFLLLLAGIVFYLPTKDGVIRFEINDPEIEVSIKGTDVVLKQADQGKDVTVTPGDRVLAVKRGDFSFETDKLVLKKGSNVTIRVELLAEQIKVHQGDRLLGQSKLDTDWPDRALAEWVLSRPTPGAVAVKGIGGQITAVDQLPTGQFELTAVRMDKLTSDTFGDAELERLGSGPHLTRIELHPNSSDEKVDRVTDEGLKRLAQSPCGESLNILVFFCDCPNITDEAIPHLNQFHSLRSLTLAGTSVSNAGLQRLNLPELCTLSVSGSSVITPECLVGLDTKSANLSHLTIIKCPFGEASLEPIMQLKNVYHVDLSKTGVTDETIIPIIKLPMLTEVLLKVNPRICDSTVERLSQLPNLAELSLNSTSITNSSCVQLRRMSKLTRLHLYDTAVSDEGLESLAGLTNLEFLNLGACPGITEAAVRKLQAALPNCKIDSDYPN